MDILSLEFLLAIAVLVMTLLSGWYPFAKRLRSKRGFDFPIGESFSTGIFLGAGLLHLLPEANILFHKHGFHFPIAYVIAGATFLVFLWMEHLGRELYHHGQESSPAFAIIALVMLSFHSLMVGAAIGFSNSFSVVLLLFFAVMAHKWAESFAIAVHLNKSALSNKTAIICFLIFSIMTPLGITLGNLLDDGSSVHELFAPVFWAVSAGTFLYLGTLHGLERGVMVQRCCNLRDFSFVIIGFVIMAILAAYGF